MSLRIKRGDLVEVTSGSVRYNEDTKKRGRVRKVLVDKQKVVVEELNKRFKHMRPSAMNPKGGRVEKEAPLPFSNVMLVCPGCDKTTRIKVRANSEGRKVRYCQHCEKDIDTGTTGK